MRESQRENAPASADRFVAPRAISNVPGDHSLIPFETGLTDSNPSPAIARLDCDGNMGAWGDLFVLRLAVFLELGGPHGGEVLSGEIEGCGAHDNSIRAMRAMIMVTARADPIAAVLIASMLLTHFLLLCSV